MTERRRVRLGLAASRLAAIRRAKHRSGRETHRRRPNPGIVPVRIKTLVPLPQRFVANVIQMAARGVVHSGLCHSEVMSMLRKVGMALLRGVLAVQVWVYRRTKGRLAGSMGGTPVLLLTTTGRKSGASRTRPVGFLPDGERFLVCGSNGGADRSPAWALNLRSHPDATVEVGARTLSVVATEVTGAEYEDVWARYVAAYPGFAGYRTKTQRHLPIFILEGRNG